MSDVVIAAEGLGKRFSLGHRDTAGTLRDALARAARQAGAAVRTGRLPHAPRQDFWALRDVDFAVRRGDAVGVIGRNGAGKSTLLKILSRITDPTEGRVTLRGRVASLLEVGTGFHPELSGRENIFLNGAILGMTRAEIRRSFDAIVDFAGVERFLDTPVKRYSSGMYVRLAFSVAAHLEPEILIVDEVLAVGDAEFQRRCLGTMRQFASGGRTVIFVSHQLPSIARLCNRALLFEAGRLAAEGTPQEMIAAYRGASTSTAIDVALPRRGRDIALAGVRIANVGADDGAPLSLDRPLVVTARLAATRTAEVAVSLALLAPDGTVVLATNSANSGLDVALCAGERDVAITLDGGQLHNAEFVCRVAVWSRSEGHLDEFESEPVRFVARDATAPPVRLNGYVNPRAAWRMAEVAP